MERYNQLTQQHRDGREGGVVTNWHFSVLFALFFLTLTNTILQILSYHPHHTRSNPFRLLTQFPDKQDNACIGTHDVADTTFMLQRAARFKTRRNTSSIV